MKKIKIITKDPDKFNDTLHCSLVTTSRYSDDVIYIRKEYDYLQGWFGITDLEDEFVDYLYLPRQVFISSSATIDEINNLFMQLSDQIEGFETETFTYMKEN